MPLANIPAAAPLMSTPTGTANRPAHLETESTKAFSSAGFQQRPLPVLARDGHHEADDRATDGETEAGPLPAVDDPCPPQPPAATTASTATATDLLVPLMCRAMRLRSSPIGDAPSTSDQDRPASRASGAVPPSAPCAGRQRFGARTSHRQPAGWHRRGRA